LANNALTKLDAENSPYSILIGARSVEDLETAREMEPRVLRAYLITIREMFRSDIKVQEAISSPASERRDKVMTACVSALIPGTDDIWAAAIDTLLEEHDRLALLPSSQYIVDNSTGLVVLPLNENSVFTPPDYVGEDGQVHKANPIVNPGVSSTLGLVLQEKERVRLVLAQHKGPAYEHLRNPNSIVRVATNKLHELGIEVGECEGTLELVEVGREQVDGIFQAPNPAFLRFVTFGELLARKIAAMKPSRCDIGCPELKQNAKHRWYQVPVKIDLPSVPLPNDQQSHQS
jgi:hypothetical protein